MLESRNGFGNGRRILLVEDDSSARTMIARHLKRSGFMVTAVESAEIILLEGLDPVFDVVVSDVHLPGMSGIELAGTLLTRRPTQPIVLVTGDPDEALAREALSRGPVSYLLKPFELFELDAAMRQALARARPDVVEPGRRTSWTGHPAMGSAIPDGWLEFVDEQSYAGPEHAERVARIAVALLTCLPEAALEITAAEIGLAARTHEIGRLAGPSADPVEVAVAGARLLADAGFPAVVVRAVRHLHERWDGSGGPDGYAGSRIPAASRVHATADTLDH
jgi:response regulator RpfG family c-di-GMP phosphodiesterase